MAKPNKELKTPLDWAKEYVKCAWPVFPVFRAANSDCSCPPRHPSRKQADSTYGPCGSPGKHPLTSDGHKSATTDIAKIKEWFTTGQYNIAIRTGTNGQGILVVMDIDQGDGKPGAATLKALEAKYGELPDTLVARTGSGGRHYVFWAPEGAKIKSRKNILRAEAGLPDRDGSGDKTQSSIDVRAEGGYVVAAPSNHVKGDYSWVNWGADIAELPAWLLTALAEPARPVSAVTACAADSKLGTVQSDVAPDDRNEKLTAKQVVELLNYISPDDYDDWMMFGFVLKTIRDWIGGDEAAFEIFDKWCQKWRLYQERAAAHQRYKWETAFNVPSQYPIGLLKKHARAGGWTPSEEFQKQDRAHWKETAQRIMDALPDDAESDSDAVTALFNVLSRLPEMVRDDFLAKVRKRFKSWRVSVMRGQIDQHRKQQASDEGSETDYAMMVARQVLAEHFENGKHLLRTSDKSFWRYNGRYWEQVANEEEIGSLCLEATRALGAIRKDVDTVTQQAINLLRKLQARAGDPLRLSQPPLPIINCKNGELWLQEDGSVKRQDHSPDSFLRFCLDIEYDPTAECPLFDAALLAIFQKSPDPADLRRHLYEVFGYTIQPERYIKQFWLWEGGGDNGKTAVVDTLCLLVGSQSFFPADIRKIAGEYYLSHLKTKLLLRDDDVSWNTVLPDGPLKQLSEGKVVLGRDPHGKPKEFTSCVVPILLCNKYPITKDLSRGVLTRVHVIPFRHCFEETMPDGSPGDMDRGLFKRIWKNELPGILNRSIEGLRRLREHGGYQEPKDCLSAKQEFLREANPLPRFIAVACASTTTPLAQLHQQARLAELRRHFNEAEKLMAFDHVGEGMESVEWLISVAMAKVESDRLRQPLMELYRHFWQWTRNEGIQMAHKPTRADVENYLVNLGYAITIVDHQKWVEGVRAVPQVDERPEDGM